MNVKGTPVQTTPTCGTCGQGHSEVMHGGDNSFVRCGLFGEIKKKREIWSCWVPPACLFTAPSGKKGDQDA